jgi:LmbE family N-acetylglucosaminyl deacetylase
MTTLETLDRPTDIANPFDLNATDKVGIFIAHPDDELMIGYAMALVGAQALAGTIAAANVYIATDGEASTVGNKAFVQNGLRKAEGQASAAHLGYNLSQVYQPGLRDLQLEADPRLDGNVAGFIATRAITVAITLGREGGDGHPDHIALHNSVTKTGIPTYGLTTEQSEKDVTIRATPQMRAQKLGAVSMNRSQILMIPAEHRSVPLGWVVRDGFAMPERTVQILDEYDQFLTVESYSVDTVY